MLKARFRSCRLVSVRAFQQVKRHTNKLIAFETRKKAAKITNEEIRIRMGNKKVFKEVAFSFR